MKKNVLIIIQFISISRAISGLFFVTIALNTKYRDLASILYLYACVTDLIDGFLARKFKCATKGGGILDLFGDKYLTIASLFYAAFKGISPLPISILAFREVFLLVFRTLANNGNFIIPTNRIFGGIYTFFIWSFTFILLRFSDESLFIKEAIIYFYWGISMVGLINIIVRVIKHWKVLIKTFTID